MDAELHTLTEEKYVALTTFRRNGDAVATPVWSARDGDALIVTTPSTSGKVKRLRNNADVTLQACGQRGQIKPGAPVFRGRAEILESEADVRRGNTAIVKTYGLVGKVLLLAERIFWRRTTRVILRITPPA